jgi:hypothetical protein
MARAAEATDKPASQQLQRHLPMGRRFPCDGDHARADASPKCAMVGIAGRGDMLEWQPRVARIRALLGASACLTC